MAAFEESRALYARRGEDHLVGQLDSQMSYVHFRREDLPMAIQLAEDGLGMGRRYADQWAIAMCTTLLGHFRLAFGDAYDRPRRPAFRPGVASGRSGIPVGFVLPLGFG